MAIVGIDHVQLAIPARSEPKAREFYSGLLGLTEVPKPPEMAKRGGLWFENGSVKIHLGIEEDFRAARKAHPALIVSDLESLIETLRRAGYELREDLKLNGYERWHVHDPFGNRIELMQRTGS